MNGGVRYQMMGQGSGLACDNKDPPPSCLMRKPYFLNKSVLW